MERVILPDSCLALDYMLHLATSMLDELVVHEERMRRNLESSRGLVFSQSLLLALVATGMLREQAYRLVQQASRTSWEEERELRDVALQTAPIVEALGRSGVDQVFDLQHHLRHVDRLFERVLEENPR